MIDGLLMKAKRQRRCPVAAVSSQSIYRLRKLLGSTISHSRSSAISNDTQHIRFNAIVITANSQFDIMLGDCKLKRLKSRLNESE